ncbi:MAG: Ig-like domain-containing protein [Bacteroidota bacterium]
MRPNTYTALIGLLWFLLGNFVALPALSAQNENDIVDLRIHTEVDCGQEIVAAAIQIKAQVDTFRIGTSSILFNYDANVLEFLDYTSENFDENDQVSIFGTPTKVWDEHKFNSSFAGTFNLTLLAELPPASFPIVDTDWLTIGIVRFTVKNMNGRPNFTFDIGNTNFNRHAPNNGDASPTKGQFGSNNDIFSTQCSCDSPTLTDDVVDFDCTKETVEFNVAQNDVVSNATFSILSNPLSGVANINSNGTLSYTTSQFGCRVDELTYRVCNDGDDNCCAVAKVTINLADDVKPIFANTPQDMTVSCGQVPEMEDLEATDNCVLGGVTKKEEITDGDCASTKIYTRTWTAFDQCDNLTVHTQKITVLDDEAPTITCSEEIQISCQRLTSDIVEVSTPTVSDNCASADQLDVTFQDEPVSEVCANNVKRQFKRTWTVIDLCGNLATCTQLIKIIDDLPPTMDCPADVTVDCGQPISPERLESMATATDACSAVEVTFTDSEVIDEDCDETDKIITRTWAATDECGHATTCAQKITIKGKPCPQAVSRDTVVYRCENEVVNLATLAGLENNASFAFTDKNTQTPITNTTQYELPITGCAIGNFEFAFQVFDERQCVIENSVLTITTIPTIIAEPVYSVNDCQAELVLECPDLYTVGWSYGQLTGTGSSVVTAAGDSGLITFDLQFKGLELPTDLELPCLAQTFEVEYACPVDCPPGIQEEVTIIGCEGDLVNLRNRLQLADLDRVETQEAIADLQAYQLTADSTTDCGLVKRQLIFAIFNEDDCPIREVKLNLEIVKPIRANITHDNEFCEAKLDVGCPDLYQISWKDSNGKTGDGKTYEGEEGTAGVVTFYVVALNDAHRDLTCAQDSFSADFVCEIQCPETVREVASAATCANGSLDISEAIFLKDDLAYTVELIGPDQTSGIALNGQQLLLDNPFGCAMDTVFLEVYGYDERQCLVREYKVDVTVLPYFFG